MRFIFYFTYYSRRGLLPAKNDKTNLFAGRAVIQNLPRDEPVGKQADPAQGGTAVVRGGQ